MHVFFVSSLLLFTSFIGASDKSSHECKDERSVAVAALILGSPTKRSASIPIKMPHNSHDKLAELSTSRDSSGESSDFSNVPSANTTPSPRSSTSRHATLYFPRSSSASWSASSARPQLHYRWPGGPLEDCDIDRD